VDGKEQVRQLWFPTPINYPSWYVARARLPADWPRPLQWTAREPAAPAPAAYDLGLRSGEQTLVDAKALPCGSTAFRSLEWLGFVSLADTAAVFYLDNIRLDLERN
jgi:hypothetical protein